MKRRWLTFYTTAGCSYVLPGASTNTIAPKVGLLFISLSICVNNYIYHVLVSKKSVLS